MKVEKKINSEQNAKKRAKRNYLETANMCINCCVYEPKDGTCGFDGFETNPRACCKKHDRLVGQ